MCVNISVKVKEWCIGYHIVPLLHAHISMSALPPYPPGVTRVQGIMLHIRRVGRYLKVWHLGLL